MPELKDKIKIGARVRIKGGAVIRSTNPRVPERVTPKPYWIVIDHFDEDGNMVWLGSANHRNRASKDDVDRIEDWA